MSYTQYLRRADGSYVPTPNGQAQTLLHGMLQNGLKLTGDTHFRVRATGQDGAVQNNAVTSPLYTSLAITEHCELTVSEDGVTISRELPPYAFAGWHVQEI